MSDSLAPRTRRYRGYPHDWPWLFTLVCFGYPDKPWPPQDQLEADWNAWELRGEMVVFGYPRLASDEAGANVETTDKDA